MINYLFSKEGVRREVAYATPDIPLSTPYPKAVTNTKHIGKWKDPQPPCGDGKIPHCSDPQHFKIAFFSLFS